MQVLFCPHDMEERMFEALYIEKTAEGGQHVALRSLPDDALPQGDVTVRVLWSSLNYKDALAVTGRGPVVRTWPMVPGVDAAGIVEHTTSPEFQVGQSVVLNGCGAGELHWGGYAQRLRVPGNWLVPLPAGLDAFQAMALGTAGFTAMLCVMALEREGVRPVGGPVLVTGGPGGGGVATLGRGCGLPLLGPRGGGGDSDRARGASTWPRGRGREEAERQRGRGRRQRRA